MLDSSKFTKFKKNRGKKTQVSMHHRYQKGDELVGVYVSDDHRPGYDGQPHPIIVIKTEIGDMVGVWRTGYVNKAINIQNAQPGHYVSIICNGWDFNKDGLEYPVLDIEFEDPATL
jgi:hypothetical protein